MTAARARATLAVAVAALLAPPAAGAQEVVVDETTTIASFDKPSFLLSVGAVVDSDAIDDEARVVGTQIETAIEDQSLSPPDRIYVSPRVGRDLLDEGDWVQTYRRGRSIVDPVTQEPLGALLLPTGVAEVEFLADGVATARLRRAYRPVLVGDFVRRIHAADTLPVAGRGGVGPARGHVVAFQEEKAIHPPFDIAFVRDDARALDAGDVILLYREGESSRGRNLPEVRLGTAVVVRPGAVAAVILTRAFRSDIEPGVLYRTTDEETAF